MGDEKMKKEDEVTEDMLLRVVPKYQKSNITPKLIKNLNKVIANPDMRDNFRDNLLGFVGVMKEGRYTMVAYINAVRYVSYKLLGNSNIESYTKVFPVRYQEMVNKKYLEKHIAGVVSAYNKTQLVNKIYEQTIVPSHILNQDLYQKALNVQAELMVSAKSDFVRSNAANSLLAILKSPETQKIELDIGLKEDKSIDELRATTLELVKQQKLMIEAGARSVKEVAHSRLLIEHDEVK